MKPSFSLRRRERALSSSPRTLTPSSTYSPEVNSSSRPAMFRKLVLPEPDGPVTVTNSPSLTSISKPRRACVSIMWVRYTLLRLVMRSMVCPLNWLLIDRDAVGVVECIGACHYDFVALLQSGYDFDCRDAGRAHRDRGAHGDAVADHVGIASAFAFD